MISRRDLFIRLGIIDDPTIPNLHKITAKAWTSKSHSELQDGRFRSAFWGGMFPAGDMKHCGRKAMYGLLNLPKTRDEAPSPKLMATSQAGSDVERQITRLWRKAGISIVGDLEEGKQLRFQDPRYWYSSALDDVLDLRPDVDFVVPVDIKSKKEDVINEGKVLKTIDPQHRAQVIGYIYICREKHYEMGWHELGLRKSEGGFVYYASRDNPSNAYAVWVPYVESEVEDALKLLAEWRNSFVMKQLPQRPKSWRWTENPCKWCDFKKRCKQDYKDGVTDLFESEAIKRARAADPDYDPEKVHAKVIERWA